MKEESYFSILQYQNLIETKRTPYKPRQVPPTTFIKMTLLYDPQLTLFRGWAELYTPHLALF